MNGVENWNHLFLNGLCAAVKSHFDSIVCRGIIYEERNIEGFLNEVEREKFEKAIKLISTGTNFPDTFAGFVDVLKETNVDGKILAIVPCDFSHFICVTTGNYYGIEIHPTTNSSTALMKVYCESTKKSYELSNASLWEYHVDKEKVNDYRSRFKVNLAGSQKEIVYPENKVNLYCRYDEYEATILRRVDSRCNVKVSFNCTSFIQNKFLIEAIELCYLTESFGSSEQALSRLATILANYNISINSLEFARGSIYQDIDDKSTTISSIAFQNGEKITVKFLENGASWTISKNGDWTYCKGDSLVITHQGNAYNLSSKASFVTYDDLEKYFSSGTEISNNFMMYNKVIEIIEKAEKYYIPKIFPETQKSVH